MGICGDLFVTVALADSLFFSIGVDAARPRVLLYLVFTMAPFAVVAPVLGPFLDRTRGGRRMLIAIAAAARAVLCLLMAAYIDDFMLYPLTFGALVASKGQSVAKSALVPAVVDNESELVSANSRLALIAVLAGAVGALPATLILKLGGGEWVLRVAAVIFVMATILAVAIPKAEHVGREETAADRRILHAPSIVVAGSAMGFFRGVVGFMTFFAAFVLKRQGEPAWVFGLVIAASAFGNGVGVLLAPLLRRRVREEWILAGSLLAAAGLLVFAARGYGRPALTVAAAAVAAGASCGRLAFDSLVQRDAHEAARGRAFARFETRFQLVWVAGAVVAVAMPSEGGWGCSWWRWCSSSRGSRTWVPSTAPVGRRTTNGRRRFRRPRRTPMRPTRDACAEPI
ncbi:MAG: MFS transporter [Acidimicrobiia bacterium]|nr:MFS transporter [Acidimicrobiia bacterium]